MGETMEFRTKLWRRSQNSHASTIPREILLIKSAPVGDGAEVVWSINSETGQVEVSFESVDDDA